jgi:hypothetical protein
VAEANFQLSFSELSQKIYIPAKVDKTLDKSVFSV